MARKRLNIKFIVIGVLALVFLAAAGTAYKFRKRIMYGPPDKLVAEALKLLDEGDYELGTKKLYDAATVKGADPYIYCLIGDAWDLQAGDDTGNNIAKARGFWENALSVDPRYLPALQRILDRSLEMTDLFRGVPNQYQGLREVAERHLVIDPDDKKAQYALHMATIQLKRAGGQIEQTAVDDSVKAMEKIYAEDPSNADALRLIAEYKLVAAQEAYRGNDDVAVQTLKNELAAMADTATQSRADDAAIHHVAGHVYRFVGGIEQMTKGDPEPWKERAKQALTRARELVKPDDKIYREVHSDYAEIVLLSEQKLAEAEQVYQDLLKTNDRDYESRLRLGELVGHDPKRRDEAVKLLTHPIPPAKELKGLEALRAKEFEARSLTTLLDIQLNEYFTIQSPEQRKTALAQIEDRFAKVRTLKGERPDVMQLQGRIQIAKGEIMNAVQTLSAALRAGERQHPLTRMKTMDYLARCYIMTGQTGQAKRTLNELISLMESFSDEERTIPTRLSLIRLLVDENNLTEARPHLEIVSKHLPPDDPRLVVFRIYVMGDSEETRAERKKLFDSLPQETREQVLEKARIAARALQDDELALKLMESVRSADPADLDVVRAMVSFYVSKEKKDQAARVIGEALAKAPDNLQLQMMQKGLEADTAEEVQALRQEAVESISDPFQREIRLFQLRAGENNLEQARVHLDNAEKLKPDEPALLEMRYRFHTVQNEFDKAQQYLDRLAQKDPGKGEIERINFALARGDRAQALERAQQLTRERGEFALSYLMLAQVHSAMNNVSEALSAYKSALERDSRNISAIRGIIECYYRVGQPTEARRYIDTARRIYPNDAQIRELALDHEVNYGDAEQAIAPRLEQLNNDKENSTNWLQLGQAYLASWRQKSAAGRDTDAKAHLAKAQETLKQGYAKWPADQRFATAVAQIALRQQKFDEGEKALRDLAERPEWKDRHEPKLLLAEFLMAAGKDKQAEDVYRALLDQTKDVGLELRLADLIFRQNRLDDALAVLQLNADHPMIRRQRIELLLRGGRVDDAQKELDSMKTASAAVEGQTPEQIKGNEAVLHELQAAVYVAANKPAEAMDAVNKSLAAAPNYPMALYRRGVLRLNTRGDARGAIEDLTAVRNAAPQLTEPRIALARAHKVNNDTGAAIRELEDTVRDVPTDKAVRLELVRFYSEAIPARWTEAERVFREARDIPTLAKDPAILSAEAKMWAARNDMQRAVRTIQEAAQAAPQDLSVIQTLLDVLNQGRQYREVLNISDRLLKTHPNLWWAFNARGVARSRMDDKDNALIEFQKGLDAAAQHGGGEAATQAIINNIATEVGVAAAMRRVEEKAANDNRWRMVAAQLLRSQADYAGALRYVQQVLDDPGITGRERANIMHLAGELYCNQSPPDISRAIDTFKKLIEMNPEDVGALNNLAAVMTMPGSPARPEEALPYSQKAYELTTRTGTPDAAILDTYGSILVLVGRIDEGVGHLQMAIDRRPLPDAYFHLGDAYLRQSKPDEAEEALRRARELISQAERDKQPVDPTLRPRVEEALIRASALRQQKTSSAN